MYVAVLLYSVYCTVCYCQVEDGADNVGFCLVVYCVLYSMLLSGGGWGRQCWLLSCSILCTVQ